MAEAPLAVVIAGVGGVTLGILHRQLGHLGVHTVELRYAVLLPVLQIETVLSLVEIVQIRALIGDLLISCSCTERIVYWHPYKIVA